MLQKLWAYRSVRYALAFAMFIPIGYVSDAVTARSCEEKTDAWLKEELSRNPTSWPHRGMSWEPATFTFPWIAEVEYCFSVARLGGACGTRYYLCLFGFAVLIRDHVRVAA